MSGNSTPQAVVSPAAEGERVYHSAYFLGEVVYVISYCLGEVVYSMLKLKC